MYKRGIKGILENRANFFWTEVAVAGIGAVGGLLEGGGSTTEVSGISLPPNFELDLLDQVSENLNMTQQEQERLSITFDTFSRRVDLLEGLAQAETPDEQALADLRTNALELANVLGADAKELANQGFLTAAEAEDFQQARQLAFGEGELGGASLDAFERQKGELLQQLRRSGASPATVAQAVDNLERSFRGQTAQNLLSLTQQRSATRMQNIGQAQQTLGGLQATRAQEMASATQGLQGRIALQQAAQGLRQERLGTFEQLGQFDLSGRTRSDIEEGNIGSLRQGTSVTAGARADKPASARAFGQDWQQKAYEKNKLQFADLDTKYLKTQAARADRNDPRGRALLEELERRGA